MPDYSFPPPHAAFQHFLSAHAHLHLLVFSPPHNYNSPLHSHLLLKVNFLLMAPFKARFSFTLPFLHSLLIEKTKLAPPTLPATFHDVQGTIYIQILESKSSHIRLAIRCEATDSLIALLSLAHLRNHLSSMQRKKPNPK